MLLAPSLLGLPGVRHAFSLALGSAEDQADFLARSGLGDKPFLRLKQVHGDRVVDAAEALAGRAAREGDALVSGRPDVVLAVAHADCVPILLADPEAGLVGAVHAGWRGMRARVLARTLETLIARGAVPARLRAAIGPAVQGGCYTVGDEVRAEFERAFPGRASGFFDGPRLDLVRAAREELRAAMLPDGNVSVLPFCTHCRPELASYRREGQARGTNLSVISLT